MTFTNWGKKSATWNIGSDTSKYIQSIAIGSGSGTALASNVTLVSEHTRTMITGSPDFSEDYKAGFQGDFNSVTMSGLTLTEFGLFTSGALRIGSTWTRSTIGSIAFDGTQELQVLYTVHVI